MYEVKVLCGFNKNEEAVSNPPISVAADKEKNLASDINMIGPR